MQQIQIQQPSGEIRKQTNTYTTIITHLNVYVEIKFTFSFWNTTIQLDPSALLLGVSCWQGEGTSAGQPTCQQPSVIQILSVSVTISSKSILSDDVGDVCGEK